MTLRVLSLWQPWASLLVVPADRDRALAPFKIHETRHWVPKQALPIRVVIHAAKHVDTGTIGFMNSPEVAVLLERIGYTRMRNLPFGALIGLATIRAVHAVDQVPELAPHDRLLGNYSANRYAWRMADPLPFARPIPYRGRQSVLYPLEGEFVTQVTKLDGTVVPPAQMDAFHS